MRTRGMKPSHHHDSADRLASQQCPCCHFGHEGDDLLCDVCCGILTSQEQAQYRDAHKAISHNSLVPDAVSDEITPAPLQASSVPQDIATATPLQALPDTTLPDAPPASVSTPRSCTICAHPHRAAIDTGFLNDTLTLTKANTVYGLHRTMLSRHRITCLGLPKMSKRDAAQKAARANQQRPRRCIVCRHPDCAAIDTALLQGVTGVTLMRQYAATAHPFSDHSASLHRRVCLGMTGMRGPRPILREKPGALVGTTPHDDTTFAARVTTELERIAASAMRITAQQKDLTIQLEILDRQRMALQMWQEEAKKTSGTPA